MSADRAHSPVSRRRRVRQFLHEALAFLLPPVCVSCRRVGALLCDQCRHTFRWLREPLCQRCGRPIANANTLCHLCQRDPLPLTQLRAVAAFEGAVRDAIHALKYEGMFGLAPPLSELMAENWPAWSAPVDLVLPIPLHPERERERGYNQATLLTEHLCRQLGLESNIELLRRIRHTRPQVGLDRAQRKENVNGAFAVMSKRVADKHILLIDDVCTTGATMSAAAGVLLESGARCVSGYCLAQPVQT